MKIGIIGQGFVGKAVFDKLSKHYDVLTYDINEKLCNSSFQIIKNTCEIIFTCVPTPMNKDGSCHIEILKKIIKKLSSKKGLIIVNKSTVVPGTTKNFNEKFKNIDVVFNPEFLTERNAKDDYENQTRIIIGGPKSATTKLKMLFVKVFPSAHIIKTGSSHAEMIKYFTNSFLATKVSFANEMHELCEILKLDYDKIVEYAILDNRLGNSHWAVPGPDADFGFGGHCFPKDLSAIIKITEDLKTTNNVLKSVKKTNDKVRKNRDWEKMKGRAVN
jgi:UDPglucose 6-dehydrogenase